MKHSFSAYKFSFLFILCLTTFFSGCAFSDLKKEVVEVEKLYALAGKITLPSSSPTGSVIVLLYSPKEGNSDWGRATLSN